MRQTETNTIQNSKAVIYYTYSTETQSFSKFTKTQISGC